MNLMGLGRAYVRQVERAEQKRPPRPGQWRFAMFCSAFSALCALVLIIEGAANGAGGRHPFWSAMGAIAFVTSLGNVAQARYRAARDRRRLRAGRSAA